MIGTANKTALCGPQYSGILSGFSDGSRFSVVVHNQNMIPALARVTTRGTVCGSEIQVLPHSSATIPVSGVDKWQVEAMVPGTFVARTPIMVTVISAAIPAPIDTVIPVSVSTQIINALTTPYATGLFIAGACRGWFDNTDTEIQYGGVANIIESIIGAPFTSDGCIMIPDGAMGIMDRTIGVSAPILVVLKSISLPNVSDSRITMVTDTGSIVVLITSDHYGLTITDGSGSHTTYSDSAPVPGAIIAMSVNGSTVSLSANGVSVLGATLSAPNPSITSISSTSPQLIQALYIGTEPDLLPGVVEQFSKQF